MLWTLTNTGKRFSSKGEGVHLKNVCNKTPPPLLCYLIFKVLKVKYQPGVKTIYDYSVQNGSSESLQYISMQGGPELGPNVKNFFGQNYIVNVI